jgi:hypothetical protein
MPFGFRRRDPDTDYGPGSNWWEDADAQHALNDYGAAVSGMPAEERPPFLLDDWRDEDSQPTTPGWARDDQEPAPEPVCPRCLQPDCSGAYGGSCAYAMPDTGRTLDGWGEQDYHRYGSACPDPSCRGECGG